MTGSRVLYVVSEPWYFANHRLDHAKALITAGFDVHVATRAGHRADEIEQLARRLLRIIRRTRVAADNDRRSATDPQKKATRVCHGVFGERVGHAVLLLQPPRNEHRRIPV